MKAHHRDEGRDGVKQRKSARRTPLTVVRDSCKGCKEGFNLLHIGLAIAIENVIVPSWSKMWSVWLRGRGIEQFRVAYMDQLVVSGVQYQRATLKTL